MILEIQAPPQEAVNMILPLMTEYFKTHAVDGLRFYPTQRTPKTLWILVNAETLGGLIEFIQQNSTAPTRLIPTRQSRHREN